MDDLITQGTAGMEEYEFGVMDDDESGDEFFGWICDCGHWEGSYFHCSKCGREPPWGCDCSACQDRDTEDDDSMYDYFPADDIGG